MDDDDDELKISFEDGDKISVDELKARVQDSSSPPLDAT